MGGRVVAELDAQGTRQHNYVYAGGELLAQQTGTSVTWQHTNPVTGNGVTTDAQGVQTAATQLDPMGVDVGDSDPYAGSLGGLTPDPEIPQLLGGSYFPDGRCTLDGIAFYCDQVSNLIEVGAAVQCPNNDCGPRTVYNPITRRNELSLLTWNNGQLGYYRTVPDTSGQARVYEEDEHGNLILDEHGNLILIAGGSAAITGYRREFVGYSGSPFFDFGLSVDGGHPVTHRLGELLPTGAVTAMLGSSESINVTDDDPCRTQQGIHAEMPVSGPGFQRYGNADHQFGEPGVIALLVSFAATWNATYPDYTLSFGDISYEGGGYTSHHKDHRYGLAADIRPVRTDGRALPTRIGNPSYSRDMTNELVQGLLGVNGVRNILFNDDTIEGTTYALGHYDHLHVNFNHGAGCP